MTSRKEEGEAEISRRGEEEDGRVGRSEGSSEGGDAGWRVKMKALSKLPVLDVFFAQCTHSCVPINTLRSGCLLESISFLLLHNI